MAEQTYYKNSTWRTVNNIWIKISGVWKYRAVSKVKVAGTWRTTQGYTALPGATPYVQCSGNTGLTPAGFTSALYHKMNTASTPKGTHASTINMTTSGTTCQIYMGLFGIPSVGYPPEHICTGQMDIQLTIVHPIYGTVSNLVGDNFATVETGKSYLNIDLTSYNWGLHGTAWRTDDVATFTIVASTTSYTSGSDV